MKLKIIALITAQIFFNAALSCAHNDFDNQEKIIEQITQGIQVLKIDGAPGLITVAGEKAFTILTDGRGRSLVTGATFGKGRVAAITHTSWFDEKSLSKAANEKFLENVIAWTVDGKRQVNALSLAMELKPLTIRAKYIHVAKVNQLPENLRQYDLIFIDFTHSAAASVNNQMLESLKTYVEEGGSVICSALGWVYNNYGDGKTGKSLEKDFIGNRFLKEFGMTFNEDFTGNEINLSQSAGNRNHPLLLIDKVSKIIENKTIISENELNNLLTTMLSYRNKFPYSDEYLSKFEGYYDAFGKRRQISARYPVLKTDAPFLLTIGMLNMLYQAAPYNRINKMKDADIFPGDVGPGAVEIETNISFDLSRLRWQSTGLYAPAGRIVSFTLDPGEKNTVLVRIGAHSDILIPFDDKYRKQFQRGPDISMTRVLESGETLITSPYGGLIYLEKIGKPEDKIINVRINGAVPAPYFKLAETNVNDWNRKIKYYKAPWGELAGRRIIITFPTEIIRKIDNPEKLLLYWDKVASFYHELQQEPPKNYEERFVHDVQPKVGWLHAGYPIVINSQVTEYTAGLVPLEKGKNNDIYHAASWGHLHELGHNCQKSEWTFDGTVEVTVNLFTLYVTEKMDGTTPLENHWHIEGWPKLKKYIAQGAPFEEWKKDPMLGLETYILLQKDFGWEAFKKVFAAYQKLAPGEKPKNDNEKRDLWLIMFSSVVKRDLGPYFRKVGIPVSQSALDQVKKYPRWMPESL